MAFKFTLETLLRVRKRLLEMAEMELAKVVNKKKELEKQYLLEKKRLEDLRQELNLAMREGISSEEFNFRMQTIALVEKNLEMLKEKLNKVEVELAQARGNLKQRHTDCELVEGLKERQFKKYQKELQAQLQKELDELVSLKHARLRGEHI